MFKNDFPIFHKHPETVFLDSASSTQKPQAVIDKISEFLSDSYANIHRWAYDFSMNASILYDNAKKKFAQFINAQSHHEVVFTYNATYAFNLIARSLVKTGILQKGDKVLLTKLEHHANIVPWQIIAEEYGIVIDWVGIDDNGALDYVDFAQKISSAKIVSLTGASNVTGEVLDLDKISEILSALDVRPMFIIDASQRFPHMAIDVQRYGIDILVATGHKVMSDTGLGIFYVRKDLLKQMQPAFCGGGAINGVTTDGYEAAGLPFRHEPGTPHIVGAVSLLAALEYIESIGGYETIENYERSLVEYFCSKLPELPSWVRLFGSANPTNRLWVFSFVFDQHHPHDIAEMLADSGVCVRSGHHCAEPLHASIGAGASLRASLYLYNTQDDIDQFFENLKKFTS